jgi:beta-lactamase class A
MGNRMRGKISRLISRAGGQTGFYYKNLVNGESFGVREGEKFTAASIIKLPMLMVVWRMIESGEARLRDEAVITDGEKAPGEGCFSLMPGNITTTVEVLLNTMTAISDNTSTNKLLRMYSPDAFRRGFESLGLRQTRVNRMLYDSESRRAGVENYFTLLEIAGLLEGLYRNTALGRGACEWILNLLSLQKIAHKIPCRLPPDVRIAHKTGEDEGTSHDIGIVYGREPFIVGFASNGTDVYQFEDAIKNISLLVYQANEKGEKIGERG